MQYAVLHTARFNIKGQIYRTGQISVRENSRKAPMGGDNSVGKFPPVLRHAFLGVK